MQIPQPMGTDMNDIGTATDLEPDTRKVSQPIGAKQTRFAAESQHEGGA